MVSNGEQKRRLLQQVKKVKIIAAIESREKQSTIFLTKTMINSIQRDQGKLKRTVELAEFCSNSKCFGPSQHRDVDSDTALVAWFKEARNSNKPTSGPLFAEEATTLASLKIYINCLEELWPSACLTNIYFCSQ